VAGPWRYVLLAVLVCTPWPLFALDWRRLPNPNRVAVPSTGETLDAPVAPVFGRGKYFQIVDFTTGKVTVVPNPYRREKHAVGLRTAYLLLDRDVGTVVARNVGPEPFQNLTANGVHVFTAEPTTVLGALEQLRRGELRRADGPTVKIHYGLAQLGQVPPPQPDCPLAPAPPPSPRP